MDQQQTLPSDGDSASVCTADLAARATLLLKQHQQPRRQEKLMLGDGLRDELSGKQRQTAAALCLVDRAEEGRCRRETFFFHTGKKAGWCS